MKANADNFALKPEFVTSGLSLRHVEYISVREVNGEKFDVDVLDSATAIGDVGDTVEGPTWTLGLDESG